MDQPIELGRRMYSRALVLRGRMSVLRWQRFLVEIAEAMGMSPVANPAVWKYPMAGGGGVGWTIVQPLVESFLAVDVWTEHDGAYLFIASCREFFPADFREVVALFGLEEDDMSEPITLRLDPEVA